MSAQAARFHQEMRRMNRNLLHIRRGMMVGGGRQSAAAAAVVDTTGPDGNIAPPIDTTAQLVDHPKTLSILWREWMFGIGRNKPAINFTPQERNNKDNKNKYLKRKPFWSLLARLVNSGIHADAACERVFEVYTVVAGATNMSSILKAIQQDRAKDVHRNGLSVLPVR